VAHQDSNLHQDLAVVLQVVVVGTLLKVSADDDRCEMMFSMIEMVEKRF
jgi:hypothetical protein